MSIRDRRDETRRSDLEEGDIVRPWRHLIVLALLPLYGPSAEGLDLVIRNGRLIDGTGNPAFFADVAIESGRIVKVGRITNEAKATIDASGLIVSPGFIDVH